MIEPGSPGFLIDARTPREDNRWQRDSHSPGVDSSQPSLKNTVQSCVHVCVYERAWVRAYLLREGYTFSHASVLRMKNLTKNTTANQAIK